MGKAWLPIVACLLAVLLGWWFYDLAYVASRGGDTAPVFSTRRFDPYGTAGIRRLFEDLGRPVRVLERPRLRSEDRGVLLQVVPTPLPSTGWLIDGTQSVYALSPQQLLQWIADGNTVVQCTRQYTELMRLLGLPDLSDASESLLRQLLAEHEVRGRDPADSPGQVTVVRVDAAALDQPGPHPPLHLVAPRYFQRDRGLPSTAGQGFAPAAPAQPIGMTSPDEPPADDGTPRWRPLARDHAGVVAAVVRHGRGRLVVIGAPTIALNHALSEAGNLDLLLAIVGDQPLILDDWSHGIGHAGTIMELIRRFGLMSLLLQVLLVVGVYHWSTRGRRRIDHPPTPQPRSISEQVQTLGRMYSLAMPPGEAVVRTDEEVRRRLAEVLRCPVSSLDAQLLPARHDKSPKDAMDEQARQVLAWLRQVGGAFHPLCANCRYDLHGLSGTTCPECGHEIRPAVRRRISASPSGAAQDHATVTRPHTGQTERQLIQALGRAHQLVKESRRE